MTDLDEILRTDAEQWQRAVDSGARAPRSGRADSRRPLLVASAVVVLLAILAMTLDVASRHGRPDAASPGPSSAPTDFPHGGPPTSLTAELYGVTWSDPHSPGIAVFGEGTVNLSDGCSGGLQALTVHDHELTIGRLIGQGSVCGGTTGPSSPGVVRFDRVVRRGRLHWSTVGHTLTLTSRRGGTLQLTTTGEPAPSIVGSRWTLSRIQDQSGELLGSYGKVTFVIRDGRLHARDLCNEIAGDAATTATHVRFTHVVRTTRPCPYSNQEHASVVIDAVLDGNRTFSIYRGQQLIIYDGADLLIYLPSS